MAKAAKDKASGARGPFLDALLEVLRRDPPRKKPVAAITKLLASPKLAADLRAFLEVVNAHDLTYLQAGDLVLEPRYLGLDVPAEDDEAEHRSDVFMIGTSPARDPWVVDKVCKGKTARIFRVIHDDGWVEGDVYDGFEALLSAMCNDQWEVGGSTDLDAALKKNGVRIKKGRVPKY